MYRSNTNGSELQVWRCEKINTFREYLLMLGLESSVFLFIWKYKELGTKLYVFLSCVGMQLGLSH